jgi:hypothetical protein
VNAAKDLARFLVIAAAVTLVYGIIAVFFLSIALGVLGW